MTDRIQSAITKMCERLRMHENRNAWLHASEERLMLEAAGCVLGSVVPFEMSLAATTRLLREGLLSGRLETTNGHRKWERAVNAALSSPLTPDYPRRYRFPKEATRRLSKLFTAARQGLRHLLASIRESRALRASIVSMRCGLGPKQASLFLRNIGHSFDLAVLDVHVLSFMRMARLTEDHRAPSTLAGYERIEDRLRAYAQGRGEPLGRLDLALWLVMRGARQEGFV